MDPVFQSHESPVGGGADCQRDENVINHNIWSFMNRYWIFHLRQKSAVDWRECTEVQFLSSQWQVLISDHLHIPLILPAIKTSQQLSNDTDDWSKHRQPEMFHNFYSFLQFGWTRICSFKPEKSIWNDLTCLQNEWNYLLQLFRVTLATNPLLPSELPQSVVP